MHGKQFIDSNIFLYAFTDNDIAKQIPAKNIIRNNQSIISVQVINEVRNNMLKKLSFQEHEISSFIENCYSRYDVVNPTQDTLMAASTLRNQHAFSYYDSIIVASALINRCDVLFSEDMQHGQVIEGYLKILNPFTDCIDNA